MASLTPEDLSGDKLLATLNRDGEGRPVLGDYTLLRKLGVGGMGAVYYGIHPRLKREVAIKILPFHLVDQEPEIVKRFLAEARMAASLESDNVVQVLDVGEDRGTHYFVMQFVAGESAGAYLRRLKSMGRMGVPEADALDIIMAAARGLALAHSKGIVHRDVKPENILIPTGKLSRAKLADLGLAKPEAQGQSFGTLSHVAMGTPGYMAPEQAEDARTAGPASDVFSMGATLYALLAGHAPFMGSSLMAVMRAAAEEDPTPLPANINPAVRNLIAHCLEKDPKDRYENAGQLLVALERVKKDPQTGEAPTPVKAPGTRRKYRVPGPPPKPKTPMWIWAIPVAAVIVVAVIGALVLGGGGSTAPDATAAAIAEARKHADAGDFDLAVDRLRGVESAEAASLRRDWEKRDKEKREKAGREAREAAIAKLVERMGVFEATGKIEEALVDAAEILKLDPDHAAAKQAKARLDVAIVAKRDADKRREAYEAQAKQTDGLIRRAQNQNTPESWRKVIGGLEAALPLVPDETSAANVRDAIARANQRLEWSLSREAEAKGELDVALAHAKKAAEVAKPTAELDRYRQYLERKKAGIDDKAARKREHDEAAAAAAAEKDPAKALELWRAVRDMAEDTKDKEAAQSKIAALESVVAEADAVRRTAELVKAGDDALAAGQLDAAAEKYREAQKLKADDAGAAAGLKKVDVARLQKAYEAAMAEGKAAEQHRWWEDAKAAYERALAAKPGDSVAKREIADVEKQRKASRRSISLDADGKVKMEFVLVKAGTFQMGHKLGASDQAPHDVTLTKDYWIGVTEVTQAQWEAVMGRDKNPSFKKGADLPVENVVLDEINQFIKKINMRFRADVANLPTEAEWENAYKANMTTIFPSGGDNAETMNDHAWHEGNSGGETHPVAQKKPNKWGLYDMGGNVYEPCLDAKRDYRGKVTDPLGATNVIDKVVRGGSAMNHPGDTSFCNRPSVNMGERRKNFGFRIVLH